MFVIKLEISFPNLLLALDSKYKCNNILLPVLWNITWYYDKSQIKEKVDAASAG